jgi:hypothetical protein
LLCLHMRWNLVLSSVRWLLLVMLK